MTDRSSGRSEASETAEVAGSDDLGRRRRGWHDSRPRRRPPWWPADEPWPPPGRPPWGRRRGPWARGFGCVFGLVFVVGIIGLISVATSIVGAAGPLGDVARVLGVVVLVGLVMAMIGGARTFGRAAGSLDDLAAAVERVEGGDYSTRVSLRPRAPRPVRNLVRGFNEMAARLEADEVQRRTLLADVGHELRTPLAILQGNVEAILDGVHEPDAPHLNSILDETRVLSRLVDDLRTVTLSEAGTLPLHPEPTDLGVLVAEVAASFEGAGGGVAITGHVDEAVPLLDVDPVRIREVLVNLVANALRHTPAGGSIDVRGTVAGSFVVITVKDTGAGIGPTLLPNVFDRFAKSPESRGSGLGLAIARGLVEAHDGTIDVESAPGAGSTFTLRLPLAPRRHDGRPRA